MVDEPARAAGAGRTAQRATAPAPAPDARASTSTPPRSGRPIVANGTLGFREVGAHSAVRRSRRGRHVAGARRSTRCRESPTAARSPKRRSSSRCRRARCCGRRSRSRRRSRKICCRRLPTISIGTRRSSPTRCISTPSSSGAIHGRRKSASTWAAALKTVVDQACQPRGKLGRGRRRRHGRMRRPAPAALAGSDAEPAAGRPAAGHVGVAPAEIWIPLALVASHRARRRGTADLAEARLRHYA